MIDANAGFKDTFLPVLLLRVAVLSLTSRVHRLMKMLSFAVCSLCPIHNQIKYGCIPQGINLRTIANRKCSMGRPAVSFGNRLGMVNATLFKI
jgi:hypothetical protein